MNGTNNSVKFKEFEIDKILQKLENTKAKAAKELNNDTIPATTAGWDNNQLTKYAYKKDATIFENVISVTANGSGKAFYQPHPFTILQDSYAVYLKDDYAKYGTKRVLLYIVGALNKTIVGKYGYNNKSGWNRIKTDFISLPVTMDEAPNFDYMEVFIKRLEADHIKRLEAYLKATGLSDYELTDEEKLALGNERGG